MIKILIIYVKVQKENTNGLSNLLASYSFINS